jgi:hypothetical protein
MTFSPKDPAVSHFVKNPVGENTFVNSLLFSWSFVNLSRLKWLTLWLFIFWHEKELWNLHDNPSSLRQSYHYYWMKILVRKNQDLFGKVPKLWSCLCRNAVHHCISSAVKIIYPRIALQPRTFQADKTNSYELWLVNIILWTRSKE